jgi:amino acid adenylation domain-containing protein
MNVYELIDFFRVNSIELKIVDGNLKFKGARELITSELLAGLKAHKQELIAMLGTTGTGYTIGRQSKHAGPLPASFAQQRLWFLDQFEPESALYNIASAIRMSGNLNIPALTRALNEIVARHDVLRTTFRAADGIPSQVVAPALELLLPLIDVSTEAKAEREARAVVLLQEEALTPFDLSVGPLVRAALIRLEESEHIILLSLHHIVADGWSMAILVKEVAALYSAYVKDLPSPLEVLPIQYADFSLWQRQWLSGEVLDKQTRYWADQLTGAPGLLTLPLDRPRPPVQTHRGAILFCEISEATTAGLHALCIKTGATLFMALTAAFSLLLSRYSGDDDILIGTPIANRNRVETEPLIGFFVNTLVLRTRIHADMTFVDLVQQVRATALAAYANQDVPFEQLIEVLKPERQSSYSPLFQVMLSLQNTLPARFELPGLTLEPVATENVTAKFDLSLNVVETDGGLRAAFEYNTDLFDAPTIKRMAMYLDALLEAAAHNSERDLAELSMLDEQERAQLSQWNETETIYPQDRLTAQLFEDQCKRTPDKVAIIAGEQQLQYAELNARANQLAHWLRLRGVGPDVVVGICTEPGLDMIVGLLGILKAGAAYLPLAPDAPTERQGWMFADANPALLLTQQHLLARGVTGGSGTAVLCLDSEWTQLDGMSRSNPVSVARPDNLAYIIYTSGSTGKPKGVLMTQGNLVHFLSAHLREAALVDSDRVLQFASLNFDVSVEEIFSPLLAGAAVVMRAAEFIGVGADFSDFITHHGITILDLPTALWHRWSEELVSQGRAVPASVRLLIVGGEKARKESYLAWCKLSGHDKVRWMNAYGPTEATVSCTTFTPDPGWADRYAEIPIGKPIANMRMHVLDAGLSPVPIGVPGELCIAGDGLSRGYLNRPELTAEKFVPDPFSSELGARMYRSGDLVRYLADGNIEYLGRIDTQVKLRGFRIEPGEIEAVLSTLEGVREAVVLVREYIPGDRRLVAYVAAEEVLDRWDADSLRAALLKSLPTYMVPAHFLMLNSLPLTPNGKIDRNVLPAPDVVRSDDDYVAPRTSVEATLASIWAEVLGLDRVSTSDNFFKLGGHSLLATQAISKIRSTMRIELPLRTLFEQPTLSGLAQHIAGLDASAVGMPPLARAKRDGPLPLSFAQQRLWFLDQLESGSGKYTIPASVRLTGKLNVVILKATLNEIVRRHQVLRTHFAQVDGVPVQIIASHLDLALPLIDLAHLSAPEREARARCLAEDEAQAPFDLKTGPLIRASLIRMDQDEHIVLITVHHIVFDGWSTGVLIREVAALYAAYVQGLGSPLPELQVQYADFALWQRHWLSGDILQGQLQYWTEQLAGSPAMLTLPLDRPRPSVQTHRGALLTFVIPEHTTVAVRAFGTQANTTLFMTLAAVFNILLARYSGQDDISIGTPIANRNHAGVEPLIGFFVNTLVLRTRIRDTASFADLVQDLRACALGAYANQDLPFEQLVEALKPEREVSHTPLFQVLLVLQNTPPGKLELPGLLLEPLDTGNAWIKFDLKLNIAEDGGRLVAGFEYNTDLFDRDTIARMAGHFTRLLEGALANPQCRVADLPMLDEEQFRRLLIEWNDTAADYPRALTLHKLFEEQVRRAPEASALAFDGLELSYAVLNANANRVAHYLRAQGAGPDRLVGLCVGRSPEMLIGLLGILKAGAAYVPLDPAFPEERLADMLGDAKPVALLTQAFVPAGRLLAAAGLDVPVLALDASEGSLAQYADLDPDPQAVGVTACHPAYVIYTSGSTGRAKGVVVEHRSAVNFWNVLRNTTHRDCPQPARIAVNASFTFDMSLKGFLQLLSGHCLSIIPQEVRSDRSELLDFLERHRIDAFDCTPAQLELVMPSTWLGSEGYRPGSVLIGGDRIDASMWQALRGADSTQFFNMYGPTECTIDASIGLINGAAARTHIGKPIANTQIYLLDRSLNPVPEGVAGEIHLAGDGLARGYLNRPGLTAEKFIPNPFGSILGARMYKTGDLARYLPDGNIDYLGRIDNQVKIRGFRIELGDIEAALARHPWVREAVVLAREEDAGKRQLVAYVIATDGTVTDAAGHADRLRAALLACLPEYMVPAHFVFLDRFPLTANGKLDRKALPAPDLSRSGDGFVAPRNAAEEILTRVWARVLKRDNVGIHDNFFSMGGHSLLAITLVEQMRCAGFSIPVRTLFGAPTVAALAKAAAGACSEAVVPPNLIPAHCPHIMPEMLSLVDLDACQIAAVVATVSGGAVNIQDIYPVAPLQEGILFHHRLSEQGDAYLLPSLIAFDSRERLDGFVDALQEVVGRHDILRTAVLWEDVPEPVQVVWRSAVVAIEEIELVPGEFDIAHQLRTQFDPRYYRLDVRQAPMLRGFVAQDAPNGRWLLQLLSHHLITDHTTLELVTQEIQTILQGRMQDLPLVLPFRSFVARARNGVSQEEHAAFFGAMLGHIDAPTAPFGLLDVHLEGAGIDEHRRDVAPELADRLRDAARRLGVSSASLFHVAWGTVLARISGRRDVVFGTVLFGRMDGGEGADRVMGMFINTLPICLSIGAGTVHDCVTGTHALLTQLLRHEHASLALAQRCSAVAAPTPLFSALLNYRHSAVVEADASLHEWEGIRMLGGAERTNYPLTLSIDERSDGFSLTVQIDARVRPQRVADYVETALQSLVLALEACPQLRVNELEVLPQAECERLLVQWNATQNDHAAGGSIQQMFEAQAACTPERVALVFEDQQLSYGELNVRANQLAHFLRSQGVGPDVLVGLCVERSLEMVVGLLGILKSGGAYVPLDPAYPAERLAYMLEDARPAVLLTQERLQANGAEGAGTVATFCLDRPCPGLAASGTGNPASLAHGHALAYVIYTSGSTGRPKGVGLTHAGLLNLVHAMRVQTAINADDVLLSVTSLSFDIATLELILPLTVGASIVLASREMVADPVQLLALMARSRTSLMQATPATWRMLLNEEWPTLERQLQILCGGEAMTSELAGKLLERGALLFNLYGPTETTIYSTGYRVTCSGSAPSIGRPIANTSVYILDEEFKPVPEGVIGELHIAGAGVARGYLNRPDLSAERFVPDPFTATEGARMYRTGDLARHRSDGSVDYLGRIDSQVKIRGFRIELGEIEAILSAQPAVRQAVVVAREHAQGDKHLVAYVVPRDPALAVAVAIATLRAALLESLPEYMLPAHFVVLNSFPLTPNAKIDRKALPAPDMKRGSDDYVAPQTADEQALASIWGDLLKLDRVGVHDNFFVHGGHSLLATQAVSKIRATLEVDIPLRIFFEHPTVAGVMRQVEIVRTEHVRLQDEKNRVFVAQARKDIDEMSEADVMAMIAELKRKKTLQKRES